MRLFATIFFASALFCRGAESAAGRWEGSAQIPGQELRLIVDLAQDDEKNRLSSIIIPGLGVIDAAFQTKAAGGGVCLM